MNQFIRAKLTQLARLLTHIEPALCAAYQTIEDDSASQETRAHAVLRKGCDAIDRLATEAIKHFGTTPIDNGSGLQPAAPSCRALGKGRQPITGKPSLALLPAPANPAVDRWQRLTPRDQPSRKEHMPVLPSERITASPGSLVVKPNSEYEAFLAKQLSPQTRRAYAADMKHFLNAVGLEDPEALLTVGPGLLIAYRNAQIEAGVSPATIARRLSTLRSFFSMLVTLGRMEQNPANPKIVRSPRVPREGVTPGIEPHEARRMLKAPDTSRLIGKRDRAILAVGLYMGLRREEIGGLNLSDLREERSHHVLEVRGKGGKTRVLAVPPAAYSALRDYLAESGRTGPADDTPLFSSMGHAASDGQRLSGRDVWNIVRKYAEQAGVNRDISPHSMRVAAITSALDNGAPIHRVQIMAGHADPRTTTRYYRQGEDLDESATYAVRY